MKLSLKFFCISYIIVLLSTGVAGMIFIHNAVSATWDARVERVCNAETYAVDSFLSFVDISPGKISDAQRRNITQQIQAILDRCVNRMEIISLENADETYRSLADNEGVHRFIEEDASLMMESVCRIDTEKEVYFVAVYSDFTDLKNYSVQLWKDYVIVILLLAAVSGLVIFLLTTKITRPIRKLTESAQNISSGQYGETVRIKSSDPEISRLSQSFNKMSTITKQKMDELEAEAHKRDIFVADFTHELKTPMTAIIGYAEMLNAYNLNEQERTQAAGAIYKEGKRLEKLSLQLLDLYVYQNDEIEFEAVFLPDLQGQLTDTLRFLSEKYHVAFSVNFLDDCVTANRILLLSLVYNLADNAFKASKPGDFVAIFTTTAEDIVHFCVKDEGKGIAPESLPLLTAPFYREDKARSRKQGGAGLGLSICREIATLHGTELSFESAPGKGTCVSFDLRKGEQDYA